VDCPRCPTVANDSPYRAGPAEHLRRPALVREKHPSTLEIDRCPRCGGVWLDPGEMQRAEALARARGKGVDRDVIADLFRRSYVNARRKAEEREAIDCPACGEVMFEREWVYGSQVKVEVCMGCSGVWLDEGELDDLARFLGATWG
jgi:Zn-finger nucleic acid-binding protein